MIYSGKNIFSLLASLFIFLSCSDETLVGPGKEIEVEEGIPVTATVQFGTSEAMKIDTRATDFNDDKDPVYTLAILVFKKAADGTKNIVGEPQFFTSDEIENKTVTFNTTSGKRYVYAVANYKSSIFNDLEEQLRDVTTLDGLKELSVKLQENNISVLDNQFLMSGCFVSKNASHEDEGYCVIKEGALISPTGESGYIDLKRIMSSIQFEVYSNTGAEFVPDSWQVVNVPQYAKVVEQDDDYPGNSSSDYESSKESSVFTTNGNKAVFSFLMMENRNTSDNSISTYDEREKQEFAPRSFVNAPTYSTYVVLKGTFIGNTNETIGTDDSEEKYVKAFTTYYIHLGDWREKESGKGKEFENFSISRNCRYIYKVNVVGVDKLIVEVEKADEQVWGGDGDMFVSSNNVRTFDAHYETTVISFSRKEIGDLITKYGATFSDGEDYETARNKFKENFLIYASTPKNGFATNGTNDIDWVTYKRNTKGYTDFMKYKENTSDEPLDSEGFKGDLFDAYYYRYNSEDDPFDGDGVIRYTCFIDEYFYDDLNFSDFVNQQPRTIQICTYYNKNNESSSTSTINMASYTFSQKSISTIYDLDELDNDISINGYGVEWMQEGDNLSPKCGLVSYGKNESEQGITNMWGFITETKVFDWTKYIDYKSNALTPDYKYAEYACLTKNRDVSGNGIIDDDEIHWYLPAITQYMELVVGEDALPKDVRLYNNATTTSNEFISSYFYLGDYYILSASEGLSLSFQRKGKYPYRCIRNLRNVTAEATTFVTFSDDFYGKNTHNRGDDYTFKNYSFGRLNPKAKRNNVNSALTFGHNIFDEENRLPESFDVGELIEDDITAYDAAFKNPCKDADKGWRLPNQRELFIISFYKQQKGMGTLSLYSCTKGTSEDSYCGFQADNNTAKSRMTMWSSYTKDRSYRCVRDKKLTN
ncbi:fimbrial protein [Parabacteroides gordonii]|uniref:fimbrial protein n=1 Tax=Parabacteroides gordonii TaxID=574930 RepID=UPI0026F16B9E|nr:fimbrial protein [Parabacteroides gordonii]